MTPRLFGEFTAGDCTGGPASIERGDVYATVARSPRTEAAQAIRHLVMLFAYDG